MTPPALSTRRPSTHLNLVEYALPACVFLLLAIYTYAYFAVVPYEGFIAQTQGRISNVYVQTDPGSALKIGDQLIQVGAVPFATYRSDLRQPLFVDVQPGQVVPIVIERDGGRRTIPWVYPGPTPDLVWGRIINLWIIAYVFWWMGTATVLFARPKDDRWRLFIAFNYLTALWILLGGVSASRLWHGAILLRMAVWLSIPVYVHLHWVFPRPLAQLPAAVWPILYLTALVLAVAQWYQALPPSLYFFGFVAAVTASLALLVLHFVLRRDERRAVGFVLAAAGLALIPSIVLGVLASVAGFLSSANSGALFVLPALPIGYFYAIYRHKLGGVEVRINRAITIYLFLALLTVAALILIPLADSLSAYPGEATAIGLATTLCVALTAMIAFHPFSRFVEHRLLGMPIPPANIVEAYATRIAASLDYEGLARVLQSEIASSLLVRQSALYLIDHEELRVLYANRVDNHPAIGDLPTALAQAHAYRLPPEAGSSPMPLSWARLILPITVGRQLIGLWLLGRRDPDDYYSQYDVNALQSLANQTAIALTNILQAERLRMFYRADVEQYEAQRMRLARGLHDVVLNQLALLKSNVEEQGDLASFIQIYDELVSSLRETITGLRPAMLEYGLYAGLDALTDNLASRNEETTILYEVQASHARYDPTIELHVFRMIQQACENATRHARARRIRVHGSLEPNAIDLAVEDDGVGFPDGQPLELSALMARRHFGLAGMFERAQLIGATLDIDSTPGRGTQVRVVWNAGDGPRDSSP